MSHPPQFISALSYAALISQLTISPFYSFTYLWGTGGGGGGSRVGLNSPRIRQNCDLPSTIGLHLDILFIALRPQNLFKFMQKDAVKLSLWAELFKPALYLKSDIIILLVSNLVITIVSLVCRAITNNCSGNKT